MQFDTTIHKWHTCKGTAGRIPPIRAREYLFLDNTACNLASLNLMKFKKADGAFDVERFKAAVRVFITAQEIIVDNASYPIKEIAENSPHLPHARARLREPRLAHHELRLRLRQR